MKHFKVRVQYLNGIDFLFECEKILDETTNLFGKQ